ncbi:hypothetical protein WA158_001214 [Blastocystis sp. Blastoise]
MNGELDPERFADIPADVNSLCACKRCHLVKTKDQFYNDGCDNCDDFLHMKEDYDLVEQYTSIYFDGLISMFENTESWVANWEGIGSLKCGMYAIQVTGQLPEETQEDLRNRGITLQKNLD